MKKFTILTVSKRDGWQQRAKRQVKKQTVQPEAWVIIQEGVNAPVKTRASNLNASLNAGLKQVKTLYVIFYQDFIDLQPDCFEKLLKLANPTTFVTTLTKNPKGVEEDPRSLGVDGPRPCMPAEWEANVAIAPMKALKELGGFDEEYDNGWSWDNVNVAERADILGYEFILDESNCPQLLPHEAADKQNLELNGERHAKIMEAILAGKRPIKCNYL